MEVTSGFSGARCKVRGTQSGNLNSRDGDSELVKKIASDHVILVWSDVVIPKDSALLSLPLLSSYPVQYGW